MNRPGDDGAAGEQRGCVVLVMHTTSYNVEAFVRAADKAGLRAVIASDRCHVLDGVWRWPSDSVVIDFYDPGGSAAAIAAGVSLLPPVRAVIPVGGEVAALVATLASRQLGLTSNAPAAAEAAANKLRMRQLCARAADRGARLRVPAFAAFPFDSAPDQVAAAVARTIGWPCVLKPLLLSASRGVMRADDPATFSAAYARLRRFLSTPALMQMGGGGDDSGDADGCADAGADNDRERDEGIAPSRQILVEAFISGAEVALEGVLTDGVLRMLALFDKPDPLDGPFFEETLYVTPSRHPAALQAAVEEAVREAARALGLQTGPVHAEVRLGPQGPVVIEVAARSIGGLCSRTLRFGTGLSLEDLLLRHAMGELDLTAASGSGAPELTVAPTAAGVMMIPIPAAGVLKGVRGIEAARAVPAIEDVVISARPGETLVPLPEGASYLGFIFARAAAPDAVEAALRSAHRHLAFDVAPLLSVV